MIIRISGYPGAGKTTLATRLAKDLGYEYFYAGGVFREMAQEQGCSIEEFYARIANDPSLERTVDARQEQLMAERDSVVIEGRMAPFLKTPHPHVNVLIRVSREEGARRQKLRKENSAKTVEELVRITDARLKDERAHYRSLYGLVDHLDPKCFDIVLDTTHTNAEEAYKLLRDKLKACKEKRKCCKILHFVQND